jgi:hypothetical protein
VYEEGDLMKRERLAEMVSRHKICWGQK